MIKFKTLDLFQIKFWTLWYMAGLSLSSHTRVTNSYNGPFCWPTLYIAAILLCISWYMYWHSAAL